MPLCLPTVEEAPPGFVCTMMNNSVRESRPCPRGKIRPVAERMVNREASCQAVLAVIEEPDSLVDAGCN